MEEEYKKIFEKLDKEKIEKLKRITDLSVSIVQKEFGLGYQSAEWVKDEILRLKRLDHFCKIDNKIYSLIDYKDFMINNLSKHGMVIFEPNCIKNVEGIKKFLKHQEKEFGKIDFIFLQFYNTKTKEVLAYPVFVNSKRVSSFGFFDKMSRMQNRFSLSIFYACDFKEDKIYKYTLTNFNDVGRLYDFENILGINENVKIAVRFYRWIADPIYRKYLQIPKVFRNRADQDFYTYKEIIGEKFFDRFYSIEDCKDKIEENSLNFEKDTILEFDIDNDSLSLSGGTIKARNLHLKDIKCDDLFCDNLTCQRAECTSILAESVTAESISADLVKTNYKYGVKIKGAKNEERV